MSRWRREIDTGLCILGRREEGNCILFLDLCCIFFSSLYFRDLILMLRQQKGLFLSSSYTNSYFRYSLTWLPHILRDLYDDKRLARLVLLVTERIQDGFCSALDSLKSVDPVSLSVCLRCVCHSLSIFFSLVIPFNPAVETFFLSSFKERKCDKLLRLIMKLPQHNVRSWKGSLEGVKTLMIWKTWYKKQSNRSLRMCYRDFSSTSSSKEVCKD